MQRNHLQSWLRQDQLVRAAGSPAESTKRRSSGAGSSATPAAAAPPSRGHAARWARPHCRQDCGSNCRNGMSATTCGPNTLLASTEPAPMQRTDTAKRHVSLHFAVSWPVKGASGDSSGGGLAAAACLQPTLWMRLIPLPRSCRCRTFCSAMCAPAGPACRRLLNERQPTASTRRTHHGIHAVQGATLPIPIE